MKRVFILGAGSSHELYFHAGTYDAATGGYEGRFYDVPGPLSNGFLYLAKRFSDEKFAVLPYKPSYFSNPWLIELILKRYGGSSIRDFFENSEISRRLNIEDLYIAVERESEAFNDGRPLESMNADEIKTFARVISADDEIMSFVHHFLAAISYFCISRYHFVFASYLSRISGRVVSFNWDVLLEEGLVLTEKWGYHDGYGFSPEGFIDKNEGGPEKYLYKPPEATCEVIVHKPHGSLNWYEGKEDYGKSIEYTVDGIKIGVPVALKFRGGTTLGQGGLNPYERVNDGQLVYHMMVPPGRKRRNFEDIWSKIRQDLSDADEIYSIGYAFNDYDNHVREEFGRVKFKKNVTVCIVNPNEQIVKNHQEVIPSKKIDRVYNKFSEYCRWITEQEGMKDLARYL